MMPPVGRDSGVLAVDPGPGLGAEAAVDRARAPLIWIGLAGAVVVGAALRVAFVGAQSIGYEEAFTLSVVSHSSVGGVRRTVRATESTPPLFYLITWLCVKALGGNSAAVLPDEPADNRRPLS